MKNPYERVKWILLGTMILGLATGGCKKDNDNARSSTRKGRRPDINALRGMPYAGGTDIGEQKIDGVLFRDPAQSCPGYNLFTVGALCRTDLVDEDGELINSWRVLSGERWDHGELLPNGDLLVIGADKHEWPDSSPVPRVADHARYLCRFNWTGDLLWKHMLPIHHDVAVTPAGNLLTLRLVRRPVPRIHPRIDVCDVHLTMLNEKGQVLESHSVLDAVERNPGVFPLDPVEPDTLGGPPWVDLFHANSIEWIRHENLVGKHPIYARGNILVCFRHQNRIAVINWGRNEIVWAWGRGKLDGPHDAQVLENGHILLFDNGLGRGYSRAIEIDPVTKKIVWEYKDDPPSRFFTPSMGSVQLLPNGNILLAESDGAHAFEITPTGEITWDFYCPHELDAEDQGIWTFPGPDGTSEEAKHNDNRARRATIVRMKRFPHAFIDAIIKKHGIPAVQDEAVPPE